MKITALINKFYKFVMVALICFISRNTEFVTSWMKVWIDLGNMCCSRICLMALALLACVVLASTLDAVTSKSLRILFSLYYHTCIWKKACNQILSISCSKTETKMTCETRDWLNNGWTGKRLYHHATLLSCINDLS